jgi:hypothetical protein
MPSCSEAYVSGCWSIVHLLGRTAILPGIISSLGEIVENKSDDT